MSGATRQTGRWYELFSRGSRDWLRHNDKVRTAVRERLAELATEPDVLTGNAERRVQVPVRFLEHYRFRLLNPDEQAGVGQGEGEPGDELRPAQPGQPGDGERGSGGNEEGGVQFVLEFDAEELIEWLWEELKLPNLVPKEAGGIDEVQYEREGWDKRGARTRLDRRRSMKESIKRRAVSPEGPAFTNEDLRFRQLRQKPRPISRAVVFFAMDVSSSMTDAERRLAKSFFFWALQGLRRQYTRIEPVFIAHTIQAWEFPEQDFFKVTAEGGTVASTAFHKVLDIIDERYDPGSYNLYLFYASDGENFREDRERAMDALERITGLTRFAGYLETAATHRHLLDSETARLFRAQSEGGRAVDTFGLRSEGEVWAAIRRFFTWASSDEQATEV
jgi:hypothetical protein